MKLSQVEALRPVLSACARLRMRWYRDGAGRGARLCLPDFLVIGAQKAGTTWLHRNLARHPQVFLPPLKELHYFDQGLHRSLRFYARHFEPGGGRTRGEVTPAYSVLSRERIRFIRTVMPDVRLVLILRNPIERAWAQAVMELGTRAGRTIEEIPSAELGRFLQSAASRRRGDYATILDNWLSVFPSPQLYLGFFEDLAPRPRQLLAGIFTHLGVATDVDWRTFPLATVVYPHDQRYGNGERPPVPQEIRQLLDDLYGEKIERLYARFGDVVAGWRVFPVHSGEARRPAAQAT